MIDEAPNVEFPTLNEEMQREGDEKNTPHPRAMCRWLWRPDSLACGRTRSFVPLAHSGHVGEAPYFTPPGLMSSSGAGDNNLPRPSTAGLRSGVLGVPSAACPLSSGKWLRVYHLIPVLYNIYTATHTRAAGAYLTLKPGL